MIVYLIFKIFFFFINIEKYNFLLVYEKKMVKLGVNSYDSTLLLQIVDARDFLLWNVIDFLSKILEGEF